MIKILTAPFRCVYAYVVNYYRELRGTSKSFEKQLQDLSVCNLCPSRVGKNCSICGCNLLQKTSLVGTNCPNDYWGDYAMLLAQLDSGVIDEAAFLEKLENLYV